MVAGGGNHQGRMQAILNTAVDAILTINRRGLIPSVNAATSGFLRKEESSLPREYLTCQVCGTGPRGVRPQRTRQLAPAAPAGRGTPAAPPGAEADVANTLHGMGLRHSRTRPPGVGTALARELLLGPTSTRSWLAAPRGRT
jgi:hypothetical protein